MKKIYSFLLSATLVLLFGSNLYALDPITPKSERGYGFVKVTTPLPESDTAQISKVEGAPFTQSVKPLDVVQLPVGNYQLKVKLQDNEWSEMVRVEPSEITKFVVAGYGNLKIVTPNPTQDQVEVYGQDGKLIKSFPSSMTKTLPVGTYNVKVKITGAAETTQNNVVIITNTTREISVQ